MYMGACFVYVYVSGRALDSTSLIISVDPHHTTMPCRWRMPPVRWWFLRAGAGCSGERRPTLGVAWRGLALLPCWAPIGGWGGLWVSGPRARSCPGVVDCRWSLRACATAPWGVYTVAVGGHTFGLLLCPFLGGGCGCPCGGSPGGPVSWGPPDVWARIFSMPASCLAGWGCCSPHTLLNIYMEEPYEHKRDHTHRCTLKHLHWCKNRCSQTHIVLICCCFKTYFVILVRCAAQ